MRQVFSSQRLENVEGIAKMLEDEGIEVRITHGRSYKGAWGGRRTYRDSGGPLPAVWVVRSEDQPKARQLLREAGLLGSTRAGSDSFLSPSMHSDVPETPVAPAPQKRAFRYKIALLIAIVVAVALAWNASRKTAAPETAAADASQAAVADAPRTPPTAAPSRAQPPSTGAKTTGAQPSGATAPATATAADPVPGAYPVETPPALALTLAATELDVHAAPIACLRIDGAPATAEVLAQMPRAAPTRFDCTDAAGSNTLTLDVRGYRTDGSGTGTVELAVTSADAAGKPTTQVRTLLVRRIERDWRVLRVLRVLADS